MFSHMSDTMILVLACRAGPLTQSLCPPLLSSAALLISAISDKFHHLAPAPAAGAL